LTIPLCRVPDKHRRSLGPENVMVNREPQAAKEYGIIDEVISREV
jgi:hypothetical protein